MKRYIAATILLLGAHVALAQQPRPTGQPPPTGTTPQPPAQGQAPPTGTQTPPPVGTQTPMPSVQPTGTMSPINRTPFFTNPQVAPQLKINEQQQLQLSKAYEQAWARVNQGVNQMQQNLTEVQRQQRIMDLQRGFYKEFDDSAMRILTDPATRNRYRELNLQQRGWSAFGDPVVQQTLTLAPTQQQTFNQLQLEWSNRMQQLNSLYLNDQAGATKQFNQMSGQFGQRLRDILTPEQQRQWSGMTGEPFTFPPAVYFQSTGTPAPPR